MFSRHYSTLLESPQLLFQAEKPSPSSRTSVDLSAGSTWASLGGNQAAAKAAVQQVCDDIKAGTRTNGADINCIINIGLNAVQSFNGDTTGGGVGGGASQIFPGGTQFISYASWIAALASLSSPNALQRTAWGGLPGSPVTVGSKTWTDIAISFVVQGMFTTAGFTNGFTMGCCGLNIGAFGNLDQHGLGSAGFYSVAFHEITEVVFGRLAAATNTSTTVEPWDYFRYSAAGVREITSANFNYLSQDQGTTNIATLNSDPGNDPGDFAELGDMFDGTNTGAQASRDASTPGQARDWQSLALYIPMSTSGNSWGSMAA